MKTAIALLLGSTLLAANLVAAKADEHDETSLTVSAGIKYQHVKERGEMKSYMDQYRDEIDPVRQGFADFFVNDPRVPMIALDFAFDPGWQLHSTGELEFLLSLGYGSSAIFGSSDSKKTFQTTISALEFGDSPMEWNQNIEHAGFIGLGIAYLPIGWRITNDINLSPSAEAEGGFTWYRSQTMLKGEILDDTLFEALGRETLQQLGLFQKTKTITDSTGEGYFVELMGGFKFELYGIILDARAGYKWAWLPNFSITENRDFDGIPETKKTKIDYEMFGPSVEATLGYKF